MQNNPPDSNGVISAGQQAGFVTPTYARRNMKIYAIPENELEMISSSSNEATIFFSASSFFASLSLAIFLSGIYADNVQINPVGGGLFYYGTPIILGISIVFLALGIFTKKRKNNFIETIKSESIIS